MKPRSCTRLYRVFDGVALLFVGWVTGMHAGSTWAFRTSDGLSDEELLGALTVRSDLLRRKMLELYELESDED